jgi:beta-N-acetylhexosaminidase
MNITEFSDEQLAGQRLMVGFDGTDLNSDLMVLIDTIKVGGIILFSRNVSNPDQIKALCLSTQEYAASCGQPPLFIAIDQEGGQVARLKKPFTQFPGGNPKMKALEDAAYFARVTASELKKVGINMNMAPVMDVAFEGIDSVMAGRAFGNNPKWVSNMGVEVIAHLQQNQIMAVAKHFPGIGRTTLDSHFEMPFLDTDFSIMKFTDIIPFEAAIAHDVSGIMLSHICYTKIDPKWPASLSTYIAKDLLREQMGFEGLVMTDDLDMKSIEGNYDILTVIKQIISADIDLALICHKGPNIEHAFKEILKALQGDRNTKAKALESAQRIMNLKRKYL